MSEHDEAFLRAAHPIGRLVRVGLWVAMALAMAAQGPIGIGASIVICIGLFIAFILYRDKTPEARPNDGWFWRVADGEHKWQSGGTAEDFAKSAKTLGMISMGLAVLGVALTAWIGPQGFAAILAYLVVSAVRFQMFAGQAAKTA